MHSDDPLIGTLWKNLRKAHAGLDPEAALRCRIEKHLAGVTVTRSTEMMTMVTDFHVSGETYLFINTKVDLKSDKKHGSGCRYIFGVHVIGYGEKLEVSLITFQKYNTQMVPVLMLSEKLEYGVGVFDFLEHLDFHAILAGETYTGIPMDKLRSILILNEKTDFIDKLSSVVDLIAGMSS